MALLSRSLVGADSGADSSVGARASFPVVMPRSRQSLVGGALGPVIISRAGGATGKQKCGNIIIAEGKGMGECKGVGWKHAVRVPLPWMRLVHNPHNDLPHSQKSDNLVLVYNYLFIECWKSNILLLKTMFETPRE